MPAKAEIDFSCSHPSERVEFPSRRGNTLIGDLQRGADGIGPTLVLCHGMESTRHGAKQMAMVERFGPLGFSFLRFDFSYVGDSEGRFEDLTMSGEVEDALGALDFLEDFSPGPTVLVGSSFGGAVALLAAARAPEKVCAVATIAAVADTALFTASLSAQDIETWRRSGRRRWSDGFLRSSFLDDVESLDIAATVSSLTMPVLVTHGEADTVVPPRHAHLIAQAARGEVELAMFPGVGHRFEEPGALAALLDRMEPWLLRVTS